MNLSIYEESVSHRLGCIDGGNGAIKTHGVGDALGILSTQCMV